MRCNVWFIHSVKMINNSKCRALLHLHSCSKLRRSCSTSSSSSSSSTSSTSSTLSFQTNPITIIDLLNSNKEDVATTTQQDQLLHQQQINFSQAVKPFHSKQHPVLIRNFASDNINCNALSKWKDLDYLEQTIGYSTNCFVEIGGSYNNINSSNRSGNSGRAEIAFGDYVSFIKLFHEQFGSVGPLAQTQTTGEEHELNSPKQEQMVYMAQNDITTLIPPPYHDNNTHRQHQIKDDFIVPQLCYDSTHNVGHGHIYNSMFWFGPRTCVSPLHHDPLDNLLMQFVGRKQVYLFPNDEEEDVKEEDDDNNDNVHHDRKKKDKKTIIGTSWHYAGEYGQQYNTSPIDILRPKSELLEKYPLFEKNAPPAIECVIHPGDILYIPKRWWHHVTSLDTAISVNVWWR